MISTVLPLQRKCSAVLQFCQVTSAHHHCTCLSNRGVGEAGEKNVPCNFSLSGQFSNVPKICFVKLHPNNALRIGLQFISTHCPVGGVSVAYDPRRAGMYNCTQGKYHLNFSSGKCNLHTYILCICILWYQCYMCNTCAYRTGKERFGRCQLAARKWGRRGAVLARMLRNIVSM